MWIDFFVVLFEVGWYGGIKMCLILFCFVNFVNCFDVNCGLLFEISCFGRLCLVNMSFSLLMVCLVVVEVMCFIFIYLE